MSASDNKTAPGSAPDAKAAKAATGSMKDCALCPDVFQESELKSLRIWNWHGFRRNGLCSSCYKNEHTAPNDPNRPSPRCGKGCHCGAWACKESVAEVIRLFDQGKVNSVAWKCEQHWREQCEAVAVKAANVPAARSAAASAEETFS